MISVKEAKNILFENIPTIKPKTVSIDKSVGFVLAEDVHSPIAVPQFDNSAMDGYAFSYADFQKGEKIKVAHIIPAGTTEMPVMKKGEAVRIFTGAPIPGGLDTVVMQEKVKVENDYLEFPEEISQGNHIRKAASQTTEGELVATKGTIVNPAMVGFLAGLGIASVSIFAAPKVTILTSGKELVPPGKPLNFGQIYESSSYALEAALGEIQIQPKKMPIVDDKRAMILEAIKYALEETDVLLITGGISVGDYDFVQSILEELEIEKLFYKIKQRPGKPLFAGKKDQKLVFGLPGNPASTLTCFYQYVKPALQLMMGKEAYLEKVERVPLQEHFQKKEGLTQFMKGIAEGGKVKVLTDQESYKMNSFAKSNCLVELEEDKTSFEDGDLVKVYFLK